MTGRKKESKGTAVLVSSEARGQMKKIQEVWAKQQPIVTSSISQQAVIETLIKREYENILRREEGKK